METIIEKRQQKQKLNELILENNSLKDKCKNLKSEIEKLTIERDVYLAGVKTLDANNKILKEKIDNYVEWFKRSPLS